MTDTELDRLVARANPIGDETVAQLPVSDAGSDLLEEIVSTPAPVVTPARSRVVVILAAAAVAAVVVLGLVFLPHSGRGTAPPISGTPAPAGNRVLLDAEGWRLADVIESAAAEGEMQFSNGSQQLTVHWSPAASYQMYWDDRSHLNVHKPFEILGQPGTLFQYGQTSDFTTILRPRGATFFEIRGDLGSEAAYRALVAKLHLVDEQTWLAALPGNVVRATDQARVVDEMLADIPVPTGFNRTTLIDGSNTNRYQLGAHVTGAVACAWIKQWDSATKTGDSTRAAQAVNALKSSHSWKILEEMKPEGDYPIVLWEYADQIARGSYPNGYQGGLGCH
jgi:hypothetical protein